MEAVTIEAAVKENNEGLSWKQKAKGGENIMWGAKLIWIKALSINDEFVTLFVAVLESRKNKKNSSSTWTHSVPQRLPPYYRNTHVSQIHYAYSDWFY